MEALEELMGGPKDHAHIIKGKRTKRQKLQSPIPFSVATYNSTSSDDDENGFSLAEFTESATTEEEEEDMVANCLILLAQGRSVCAKSSKPGVNHNHRDRHRIAAGFRYTSKKFLEAATSPGSGKVGMYVYQCKTCDRNFPSFQALGGHRASHKRPKQSPPVEAEAKKKTTVLLTDDCEEEEGEIKDNLSPSLSLQLVNNKPNGNPKSPPKVHECSICGAEFVSGQALGGHMRRHRVSGGTNTALTLSPIGFEYEDRESKKQRNVSSLSPLRPFIGSETEDRDFKKQRLVLSLDLDLNLPAPLEDQVGESKYAFTHKEQQQQQQSPLVLSSGPALVDCQY